MKIQYCSRCGIQLIPSVEPTDTYDSDTGRRIYRQVLKCEKYSDSVFKNLFRSSAHHSYLRFGDYLYEDGSPVESKYVELFGGGNTLVKIPPRTNPPKGSGVPQKKGKK